MEFFMNFESRTLSKPHFCECVNVTHPGMIWLCMFSLWSHETHGIYM